MRSHSKIAKNDFFGSNSNSMHSIKKKLDRKVVNLEKIQIFLTL
ncbi:hypothetical protein TSAR_007453 [Trichomalopsis sarcophagae]|uniref:Uncharacterized protein n=1 Tax=Trichomalopsis sarcophagae TaxID=543379 RepID=A0A232EJ10_9HYME|nr:hypothetical protein TSAR_007453 [Trichomalopsis sarcophagae]